VQLATAGRAALGLSLAVQLSRRWHLK